MKEEDEDDNEEEKGGRGGRLHVYSIGVIIIAVI